MYVTIHIAYIRSFFIFIQNLVFNMKIYEESTNLADNSNPILQIPLLVTFAYKSNMSYYIRLSGMKPNNIEKIIKLTVVCSEAWTKHFIFNGRYVEFRKFIFIAQSSSDSSKTERKLIVSSDDWQIVFFFCIFIKKLTISMASSIFTEVIYA